MEIIKPSDPNSVVAVAYRRWSFTRGTNFKVFTGKVLVSWLDGRLRKVVTHRLDCTIYSLGSALRAEL